jgi:nitrogen fixation NifU-like protein
MADPDGKGKKTGDYGDTMEFSLRVEQGCITRISLNIDGCIYANASAEAVAALCTGKMLEEAWEITPRWW